MICSFATVGCGCGCGVCLRARVCWGCLWLRLSLASGQHCRHPSDSLLLAGAVATPVRAFRLHAGTHLWQGHSGAGVCAGSRRSSSPSAPTHQKNAPPPRPWLQKASAYCTAHDSLGVPEEVNCLREETVRVCLRAQVRGRLRVRRVMLQSAWGGQCV